MTMKLGDRGDHGYLLQFEAIKHSERRNQSLQIKPKIFVIMTNVTEVWTLIPIAS
jgi:hypothetical protein